MVCSDGIPAVPQNKKLSEFRSAEVKNARNSVPWNKNRSKLSEFRSEAVSDENIVFAGAGFFVKLIFFMPFPSITSLGINTSVTSECLGMTTFFRGITEIIPSLFRGIFSDQYSVANLGVFLIILIQQYRDL